MDDELLIRRLQKNKRDSFPALYEQYHECVLYYAMTMLKDRDEAEEITQEVFLRVWTERHRYETGSFRSWLFSITKNAVRMRLRSRATRPPTIPLAGQLGDGGDRDGRESDGDGFPDPAPGPLQALLVREEIDPVLAALEDPDEVGRRVFYLREVEGWSYGKIARTVFLDVARVRVLLHRARKGLLDLAGTAPSSEKGATT